jgi:N-acetylneuraminic acid mutarotase
MTRSHLSRTLVYAAALGLAAALPASGAAPTAAPSDYEIVVNLNKGVWVKGPNLPSPRQDAAVTVLAGRIYLIGGFGPKDEQMASVLVFEPTFPSEEAREGVAGPIVSHPGEWHYAATMPEPVDHAAAAALDGYIYVAGGRIENLVTNKFWRYDPVEDQWSELPSMPYPRYGPRLEAAGGKLYLLGGQASHGNDDQSLLIFDPATNEWKSEQYALGTPRFAAASAVIDNRIYLVGGRDIAQVNFRSCDIYDPARDRWGSCSNMREGRSDFGIATVNNRLMAIGGENLLTDTNTQTTEISASNAAGWMSGPWMPSPRHGMAVTSLGNQIWVIGGSPYAGTAPTETVLRFVSPVTKVKFKGRERH